MLPGCRLPEHWVWPPPAGPWPPLPAPPTHPGRPLPPRGPRCHGKWWDPQRVGGGKGTHAAAGERGHERWRGPARVRPCTPPHVPCHVPSRRSTEARGPQAAPSPPSQMGWGFCSPRAHRPFLPLPCTSLGQILGAKCCFRKPPLAHQPPRCAPGCRPLSWRRQKWQREPSGDEASAGPCAGGLHCHQTPSSAAARPGRAHPPIPLLFSPGDGGLPATHGPRRPRL